MKKHAALIALLGIGAVILIIYLMRQQSAPAPAVASNEDASPGGGYPNGAPISPSTFTVGGSPTNLTYNQSPMTPTVQVGEPNEDECECECGAASATAFQTVQVVPPAVLQSGLDNLNSYYAKFKAS
jgi:hypothetical protein